MKNFKDLFIHELKDIYNAELQIVKILPDLANAAHSPPLKEAFLAHNQETQQQIQRLESIGKELGVELGGRKCEAMQTCVIEAQKVMAADYPDEVMDAALISCAQRIEHYEIALYGTLKAFANHLRLKEVEESLEESAKEEKHADKKLSEIATGTLFKKGINEKAVRKSA
jgi:ferritin-like metal-binding protein YciE